ncbi:cytochrome c5 family protein [Moraxella sp. VT-16-12]|uniref:c-type cytochrome n=1 Tax=Moraxella sp. VT-16-12 TaxID=2014877 RepID=UPI000B800B9A|nr:c-type cytochrome [Moraxella sp. VT-16-12]TWV84096.1 cytochrome c5 family protein [Moraxella sp. VT-16-12]
MKKVVTLSLSVLLAIGGVVAGQAQASQAQPAQDAAATTETAAAAQTEATTPAETAPAPKKEQEPIPQDSDQVKKLIAMHPDLVARIAPYGKVCFDGEECDINITVLAPAVEGEARPGDMLYKAICATCHDAGLVGAPKVGVAGDWAPRIGKGKATLYDHAINGFNAMPARGGADISDDEVKNAVDYMIAQSS